MKRKTLPLLVLATSISIVVISTVGRSQVIQGTAELRGHAGSLGGEFQKFVAWTGDIQQLIEDKEALSRERNELLGKVAELEALKRQNASLRSQLGVKEGSQYQYLMANARGMIDRAGARHLLLDKGQQEGVRPGMVVVVNRVLVGVIESSEDHASYVAMPITAGIAIPAVIRYGDGVVARGVAQAGFNLTAQLEQVLPTEKLEPGATILTSGEGGKYPANLVLGKVGQVVSSQNDVFQEATIELLWNPLSLETVYIIQE